jgi:hypothetical protein
MRAGAGEEHHALDAVEANRLRDAAPHAQLPLAEVVRREVRRHQREQGVDTGGGLRDERGVFQRSLRDPHPVAHPGRQPVRISGENDELGVGFQQTLHHAAADVSGGGGYGDLHLEAPC